MKRSMISRCKDAVVFLYEDENGAEGLEKLMIVGAVVLPLLGVLILLRNKISEWLGNSWESSTSDANLTNPPINTP